MRAIGPPLSDEERGALLAFARAQVAAGTRFRHQGRLPGVRLDCAGLLICGTLAVGRPCVDVPAYGKEPNEDVLRQTLQTNLGPPVADEPQPGDMALMRFAGDPRHVGIIGDYVHGGLSLIHTSASFRKVVEHVLDATWRSRIVEVYRP